MWGDARRQLIAKAVALYIDPSSINAHYAALRSTLLAHSDEYIATVLEQHAAADQQLRTDDRNPARHRSRCAPVQKALNQLSRDDRIEFIRNNGNPRIAVNIRTMDRRGRSALPPAAFRRGGERPQGTNPFIRLRHGGRSIGQADG